MIKKLKLSLLVAVLTLVAGASSAYAINLTYSDYLDIYLSGTGYTMTIKPTSYATSLVNTATNVAVVVPTSSTFTITSHNNIAVVAVGGTDATSNVCAANTNTLTIPGDSAITYTLTPGSGVCSSGGGGGSGGGGTTTVATTPAVPATPATPATPGTVVPGCGNRTTGFSTTTAGLSCVGNTSTVPATPATPATPAVPGCGNRTTGFSTTTAQSCVGNVVSAGARTYNFGTKTLKNGSRGDAVMELQRFLNQVLNLGLVVDGKLGPKTIKVIKQWQKDNNLVADGLIGAKTKAKMNASVQ